VYAQPLYVAIFPSTAASHNVLYVVTMHDTVYAFDADSPACAILWTRSFISPSAGSGISTSRTSPAAPTRRVSMASPVRQ